MKAGAQVIVTNNLDDFLELPEGIEAQSPDHFLVNLFDLNPDAMVNIVKEQAVALKRPPRTFEEILSALAKLVPAFAQAVCSHSESQEGE